jgi:xanthine dehydrogenase YagT iron-sulfur-binding subunit
MSRRGFIASMGAGVAGAAAVGAEPAAATRVLAAGARTPLALLVNGRRLEVEVEPRETLLDALRDHLGLTGTKPGCERGECGACTVLVDGQPRYSCTTLAVEAERHELTTIEGLASDGALGDVQRAFVEKDAMQCGYCTPGQVLAVEGLLRARPDPSPEEIRIAVSGNLCRCGGYAHVFEAARRAAELRRAARS